MAQYLILIYEDEAALHGPGREEDFERLLDEHRGFGREKADVVRGSNALEPTETATSIRKNPSGGFAVTDAPFAETKEALAGYVLIETENLDEAIAVAKRLPVASGGVEVRPVRTFG